MKLSIPSSTAPAVVTPILRAIAGPQRGVEIPIPRGEAPVIDDRFTVSWSDGVYLARSLTNKEVMVGGELVNESILNSGDVIVTEVGEYRFEIGSPAAARTAKAWRLGLAFLAVVALAVLAWPWLFPRKAPPPAAARVLAPLALRPVVRPTKPPSVLPEDPVDRIARARLRYALAEDFAAQSGASFGFLYWAIEEWKRVEADVSGIVPPPDIVMRARERRVVAEKQLAERKEQLRNLSIIAFLQGDYASSETALEEFLSVTQDPHEPGYSWAMNKLDMVHNLQAGQAKSQSAGGRLGLE